MARKEAIRSAYRLTGESSFYDGMITCSTLSGKAVCRLVWAMNKAKNDAHLEKAMSGIPEHFSGAGDIHFFYSADEVLYGALPDFEEACKRAGVPYTVSARPKMVHCYCMLPIFKEAKEDFAKIVDFLKW